MADSGDAIRMVAGLGNPGSEYAETRHNAGFWFLDAVADRLEATFKTSRQLNGEVALAEVSEDISVRLFRPASYVNVSGLPIAAACRYYKIPLSSLMVVHDDIDLPEGSVRLKFNGGDGGHKGIRDLRQHADQAFWRLKFGVGHPGEASKVVKYVLKPLPDAERKLVDEAIARALAHLENLCAGDFQAVMNDLHPSSDPSS